MKVKELKYILSQLDKTCDEDSEIFVRYKYGYVPVDIKNIDYKIYKNGRFCLIIGIDENNGLESLGEELEG